MQRQMFENKWYKKVGNDWVDEATNQAVPANLRIRIDASTASRDAQAIAGESDASRLLVMAAEYRKANRISLAVQCVQRAMQLRPNDRVVAVNAASNLRLLGHSEKALEITEPFAKSRDPYVLAVRAGAYCDIGHYEEAKAAALAAIDVNRNDDGAWAVIRRLKTERPELFTSFENI